MKSPLTMSLFRAPDPFTSARHLTLTREPAIKRVMKLRLVLFALVFSVRIATAAQPPCQAVHTIAPADSLASVSQFYFGDGRFAAAILHATNVRAGEQTF